MNSPYFLLFIISVITFCSGKQSYYSYRSNCRIIGDSNLLPIYKDNEYPSYQNFVNFIYINQRNYTFGYCECYTETGNCLLELDSKEDERYYKIIIEFSMETNLKNKTYDDIYEDYKNYVLQLRKENYYYGEEEEKLIPPLPDIHKIDPEMDEIFFSFEYENIFINKLFPENGYLLSRNTTQSIINDTTGKNGIIDKIYPLYYTSGVAEDKFRIKLGEFIISNGVACISFDKEFKSEHSTKTIYTKPNYKPLNIDCDWGNSSYVMIYTEENYNYIFEFISKLLFSILLLIFIYIYI